MKNKSVFFTLVLFFSLNNTSVTLGFSGNNFIYAETQSLKISNNQKMNLDPTSGERFTLTDIVWPANIGDANVCLWSGDKIAAASLTIDDNIENDHEWWLSMQQIYNLNKRLT